MSFGAPHTVNRILHAWKLLPGGAQREHENVGRILPPVHDGRRALRIHVPHVADDQIEAVLLAEVHEIDKVLLDAMLASDHPDRGRVDEEMPAFGNQPDLEPKLAEANGRLQPGETTSEHQSRPWRPWSNLLLSVLRLDEH